MLWFSIYIFATSLFTPARAPVLHHPYKMATVLFGPLNWLVWWSSEVCHITVVLAQPPPSQHLLKAGATPFHLQSIWPPSRLNQLIIGPPAELINSPLSGLQATTISSLSAGLPLAWISCSLALRCLPLCCLQFWVWDAPCSCRFDRWSSHHPPPVLGSLPQVWQTLDRDLIQSPETNGNKSRTTWR